MTRFQNAIVLSATVAVFTGCGGTGKDSTAKADSANSKKDSLHNKYRGTGDLEISAPDARFAVQAANGGMAEVELAKLAQQKGTDKQVKAFAAMMIKDHSMANMEMTELANTKKITLPGTINKEAQDLKKELAGKSGAEFDKAYVAAMVKDHQEDIELFEEARKKVNYPEMTALIDKALPMLRLHLQTITQIQHQMK
jgi:putative membrane protein